MSHAASMEWDTVADLDMQNALEENCVIWPARAPQTDLCDVAMRQPWVAPPIARDQDDVVRIATAGEYDRELHENGPEILVQADGLNMASEFDSNTEFISTFKDMEDFPSAEAIWRPPSMRRQHISPPSEICEDPYLDVQHAVGSLAVIEEQTDDSMTTPQLSEGGSFLHEGLEDAKLNQLASPLPEKMPPPSPVTQPSQHAHSATRPHMKITEVQILQAEVAMQEVQLRRLLTAHPGEHVPYEVAFEAARLWQGLEGIRAVIATLQEQCGDKDDSRVIMKDVSPHRNEQAHAGFVEDAFVDAYHAKTKQHLYEMRSCSTNGGTNSGVSCAAVSSDGFVEITRLEETSTLRRTGWKAEDDVRAFMSGPKIREPPMAETKSGVAGATGAPVRRSVFRGLMRGSGTGGGASGRNIQRTTSPSGRSSPTTIPLSARRTEPSSKQSINSNATGRRPSPKRDAHPNGSAARSDRALSPPRSRKESPPRRENQPWREAPQRRESPPRREASKRRERPKAALGANSSESRGLLAARPRSRPSSPYSPRSSSSANSGSRIQLRTSKPLI